MALVNKLNRGFCLVVLLAAVGCKDPYNAELRANDQSLLVVEGFLNQGATTTFRLSRAVPLTDTTVVRPELGAVLTVEGRDNFRANLTARDSGFYRAALAGLQTGGQYRLRIRTRNGKEYLSDYVTLQANPPIDSVSWRQLEDGVQVYVSTHDPADATRYYRWDYEETWEQRSTFYSTWKKGSPTTVVHRVFPADDVSVCWRTKGSTTIQLGSSAKLARDVIHEYPLLFFDNKDERPAFRYSVLVRQYALNKEAYEYLALMQKNSEKMGSIFDAQPSEIRGNIHSVTNPDEVVVGYVTASAIQEKRLFINRTELRNWGWYQFCTTTEVGNNAFDIETYLGPDHPPYGAVYSDRDPGVIVAWLASDAECVDCTSRGGTTKKPSFW